MYVVVRDVMLVISFALVGGSPMEDIVFGGPWVKRVLCSMNVAVCAPFLIKASGPVGAGFALGVEYVVRDLNCILRSSPGRCVWETFIFAANTLRGPIQAFNYEDGTTM